LEALLAAQGKLVPEMMELLQSRYRILKYVKAAGPVGRRALAEISGLSERETRTMIEILREQSLIQVSKEGTTITKEGIQVLETIMPVMDDWSGRTAIAKRLTELLGIQSVHVVAGDSDNSDMGKSLLGMEAAKQFSLGIGSGKIIAVTGGSSIAAIPPHLEKMHLKNDDFLFIAARGGVGEKIGYQANVLASEFAHACGGTYNAFYYPESLSKETHAAFCKEPAVQQIKALYESTDGVLHGIGNALRMAELRNTSTEEKGILQKIGAKGEAFGYYFNQTGEAVHRIRTVGIQIEHLNRIPFILAVAGGKSKAAAICSYMASAPSQTNLVTDEGAANEMIKILTAL
jgi:central glycolytic genes regulator